MKYLKIIDIIPSVIFIIALFSDRFENVISFNTNNIVNIIYGIILFMIYIIVSYLAKKLDEE